MKCLKSQVLTAISAKNNYISNNELIITVNIKKILMCAKYTGMRLWGAVRQPPNEIHALPLIMQLDNEMLKASEK